MDDALLRKVLRHDTAAAARALNQHVVFGHDRLPYEVLARSTDNQVVYVARGGIWTARPSAFQWFIDTHVSKVNIGAYDRLCAGLARALFGKERDYEGRDVYRNAIAEFRSGPRIVHAGNEKEVF